MNENKKMQYGDRLIKELLLIRDGWKCFYCGFPFSINMDGWNNISIDHVEPQYKANDDSIHNIENLVIACKNCNSAKSGKEFSENELENFKKKRAVMRKRDENFVIERFEFIQEATGIDNVNKLIGKWASLEYFNNFINALKTELDLGENEISRKTYNKIEYIDFFVNGKNWTYTPCSFELQAFFIHSWDNEGNTLDKSINDILETMGYIQGSDWRTKYLKPFITIEEGLRIIKREINAVHKVWGLMEKK